MKRFLGENIFYLFFVLRKKQFLEKILFFSDREKLPVDVVAVKPLRTSRSSVLTRSYQCLLPGEPYQKIGFGSIPQNLQEADLHNVWDKIR